MKSTRFILTTGSALLLSSGALQDQACAEVGVRDLLTMPEQRVSDLTLLAMNDAAPPTQLPKTTKAEQARAVAAAPRTGGVPLADLMNGEARSIGDLIATTLAGPDQDRKDAVPAAMPAAPAVVAKAVKGDVTVRVVIGEDPAKGPSAEKMTTEKALATKPVVAQVTPKKAAAPTAETVFEIEETPAGLKFKPESITIAKAGAVATIKIKAPEDKITLFLRDPQVAALDRATSKIKALKAGATELYVVNAGKMYIVPVKVDDGAGSKWDLQVPDALVSLSGLFGEQLQSANFQGERAAATAPVAPAENSAAPSLNNADTAAMVRAYAADAVRLHSQFAASTTETTKYHSVNLQLIDERSSVEANRLFPVGHAQVRLIGTEFSARTDDTGKLSIRDMPANARFLVAIDDPNGGSRSAMAVLDTMADGQGVQRLRLMRSFTFDAYTEAAGTAQNAGLGSFCTTVTDLVQGQRYPAPNVRLDLDTSAEGPFYFNHYGFLDRSMRATGADGRACFFNVAPGPFAVSVYDGEAFVATLPFAAFVGRHVEEDIDLGTETELVTRLASTATAHEQLSADPRIATRLQSVDMIDLIPLGQQNPMMQLESGLVSTSDALLAAHGRVHAFAQAAEFEPTVYSYSPGSRDSVTPLLPRGFVEDMSIYAQVSHDPNLGAVVGDFAHPAASADQAVSMHLVDQFGQDVGDGWYFADAPNTKAIFFNVPAGTYTLLIETKDQFWLAAETVTVYNETVSYARLGSGLAYRP